jgi:hypothetical protein
MLLDLSDVGLTITEFVSGGARGADQLAEKYSSQIGIPIKVFPADWDKYGRSAGPRRNEQIVEYCDRLIAFWDGKSKGTQYSIRLAKNQNKLWGVFTEWNTKI